MGGQRCAVPSCRNTSDQAKLEGTDGVSFHRFPRDFRKKDWMSWIMKCGKEVERFNRNTWYICSDHFTTDDFVRNIQSELLGQLLRRQLKPSAIPSRKHAPRNVRTECHSEGPSIMNSKLELRALHESPDAEAIPFEKPEIASLLKLDSDQDANRVACTLLEEEQPMKDEKG